MKRIREKWAKIPRSLRAITNIVLIAALLFLAWHTQGKPLNIDILEYRRLEKMQLIGPGTIVHELVPHYGVEEHPIDQYNEFAHTYVSETDQGIIFCGLFDKDRNRDPILSYQKKTGDITLAVPPTDIWDWGGWNWAFYLPVYVFHEYPDAFRAELDLTIQGVWEINYHSDAISEDHKEPYTKTYSLLSRHRTEDFFLFGIHVPDILDQAIAAEMFLSSQPERVWDTMQGPEGDAPQLLSRMLNPSVYSNVKTGSVDAMILLYNENNELIAEKTITLSIGGEETQEVQENEN